MVFLVQLVTILVSVALASSSVVNSPVNNDGNFELVILHNNDMHARFEQTSQLSGMCTPQDREANKCYGGFPRVAHVVKEARKAAASGEGPPVLYLNAGDTYTGTAWFTMYKWKIAAEFINALKPDAVSLGNHEFDDGVSALTPFIETLVCPVLATNLILNKEPTLQAENNLRNSVIFNISGIPVGVIGYLTPDTKFLAQKNNVEYIEEVVAIREEVDKLKKEGVKILIALGHSGFTKDLEIAEKVEDIDLVIGGHTNTFLWNGVSPDVEKPEGIYPKLVKQASGRQVPAVQAYAYTKYLGKLNLIFNSEGEIIKINGNPILLDNSVPQDPDVLSIVNRYREDILKVSEIVLGNTLVILDGHSCRLRECNMGNMITDAMVHKYASEYNGTGWTDAPIAICQGGGIRASMAHVNLPYNVTVGELYTVMPFDGKMVAVTINGSNVLKMLEHAVSKYRITRPVGQFLQFSGMKVVYDITKQPGKRVVSAHMRCGICEIPSYSPVNKTEMYKILMPQYLSTGGDEFNVFIDLPVTQLTYGELQCTRQYIQGHSPLHPAVEDRIIIHNKGLIYHASPFSIFIGLFGIYFYKTLTT